MCCVKGCGSTGPFHEEHSTPFVWTGALPDQLMCEACHAKKTKIDQGKIAKVKRLRGETGKLKRAASGKVKKIKSRGFSKDMTRGFDGTLRPRKERKRD